MQNLTQMMNLYSQSKVIEMSQGCDGILNFVDRKIGQRNN